jgi:RNA polymerase sigma factor (sigma-70 family)
MLSAEQLDAVVVENMDVATDVTSWLSQKFHLNFDDLHGEVLYWLVRARESYVPERGPFRGFARRVVRNGLMGHLRHRFRRRDHEYVPLDDPVGAAPDPSHLAALGDLSAAVRRATGLLTWVQRVILALRYREQMSLLAIAPVLGLGRTQCCQLHTLALTLLRVRFHRDNWED